MKKCPYCAEWIQDEAIKCRYCFSDLTGATGTTGAAKEPEQPTGQPPEAPPEPSSREAAPSAAPAAAGPAAPTTAPRPGEGAVRFSHSGFRFVLGYGTDFFGIWERDRPGGPVERFSRDDQGWVQAWNRFRVLEPRAVEVAATGSTAPSAAPPTGPPPGSPPGAPPAAEPAQSTAEPGPTTAGPRIGEGAVRFSHSGVRYILGYGTDFFGIWDRQTPGGPTMRFPRTDQGWIEAWNRFTAWEPRAVEVPQTTPAPDIRMSTVGNFRSGHTPSLWIAGLFSLAMVLALVATILWGVHLGSIGAFERSSKTAQDLQDSKDVALGTTGWMIFFVVVAMIVWLVWQFRSHKNLRALGAGELKYSPGWSVGWWFIPFAQYVMPYLTMRELWKASDPQAGSVDWVARRTTPLLPFWWGTRLAIEVLFYVGFAFDQNLDSIADLRAEAWIFIAATLTMIAWGGLAIILVRSIDARQARKNQRMVEWTRSFAAAPTAWS